MHSLPSGVDLERVHARREEAIIAAIADATNAVPRVAAREANIVGSR